MATSKVGINYIKLGELPSITSKVAIIGAGPIGADFYKHFTIIVDTILYDDYYQPGTVINGLTVQNTRTFDPTTKHIILATDKARERMLNSILHLTSGRKIYILEGEDKDIFAAPKEFKPVDEILKFKNLHKGVPAYVIGNGPSLNSTDPRLIKNGITFAANAIYLLEGFKPDYHFCDDTYVAEQRADEINSYDWQKFYPSDLKKWLKNAIYYNPKRVPWITEFTESFEKSVQVNATVSYTMIQMAWFMGCDPVYCIGMDHNYSKLIENSTQNGNEMISHSNDDAHFHKNYFGKGTKWHYPWMERIEAAFKISKKHFEMSERKIYNATAGGQLEVFERIDFKSTLKSL
jgi:hypothetical protein